MIRSARQIVSRLTVPFSAVLLASILTCDASAQTVSVSPTTCSGSCTPTVTWTVKPGAACTASWDAVKTADGSQVLASTMSTTTYTLSCVTKGTASLTWTKPTTNTDGSTLTDLAGYKLYYGNSATTLTNTLPVANPATLSYTLSLADGTWLFGITSLNTVGAESAKSGIVSKTITGTTTNAAATLTVTTVPTPPVLTIAIATAWDMRYWKDVKGIKHFYTVAVGTASVGQPCYEYVGKAKFPDGSYKDVWLVNKSELQLTRAYYGRLTGQCA